MGTQWVDWCTKISSSLGGDCQADWQGLAASLRGALSVGMSGMPCYATDSGGFYGNPSAELFIRWTQASVFASQARYHGIEKRTPGVFGEDCTHICRTWLRLRYQSFAYFKACAAETQQLGLPFMWALPLSFPDEPYSPEFDTEYLFGSQLLVAPIIKPGGQVRFYLPKGQWLELFDKQLRLGGQTYTKTYALKDFPVFIRYGSVFLWSKPQSTLQPTPDVTEVGFYGFPAKLEDCPYYKVLEHSPHRWRLQWLKEQVKPSFHAVSAEQHADQIDLWC